MQKNRAKHAARIKRGWITAISIALAAIVVFAFEGHGPHPTYKSNASIKHAFDAGECKPILALPAVLTEQARYCLPKNLVAKGDGIVVKADFVSLDLQDHKISGSTDKAGGFVGVKAEGVSNLRITNGTIEGFGTAISISSPNNDLQLGYSQIDDITVTGATQRGVIAIGGFTRILHSHFLHIGGGKPLPTVHTHGVIIVGGGAIVKDNEFHEIRGSQNFGVESEGIALAFSGHINGSIAESNVFSNDLSASEEGMNKTDLSPSTYAIWFGGDGMSNVVAHHNSINNFVNGLVFDVHVSGVASDNDFRNTLIPLAIRSFNLGPNFRLASGVGGYTPSSTDGLRPAGLVAFSNNQCSAADESIIDPADFKLNPDTCVAEKDVSYSELVHAIEGNNG